MLPLEPCMEAIPAAEQYFLNSLIKINLLTCVQMFFYISIC